MEKASVNKPQSVALFIIFVVVVIIFGMIGCYFRTDYSNHQWAVLRKLALCSLHISIHQDLKWHKTID
jgi:hypothetical protein